MKLNNQFTINLDSDYKKIIDALSSYYQRKPAELLRLLIIPLLHDEYAKMLIAQDPSKKDAPEHAKYHRF